MSEADAAARRELALAKLAKLFGGKEEKPRVRDERERTALCGVLQALESAEAGSETGEIVLAREVLRERLATLEGRMGGEDRGPAAVTLDMRDVEFWRAAAPGRAVCGRAGGHDGGGEDGQGGHEVGGSTGSSQTRDSRGTVLAGDSSSTAWGLLARRGFLDGGIAGARGMEELVEETRALVRQLAERKIPAAFAVVYDVVWALAGACWDAAGGEERHARLLRDSVRLGSDPTPRRRFSHAETFGSDLVSGSGPEGEGGELASVVILHVPLDGAELVVVGREADPLWDVPWDPFHMRPSTMVASPHGGSEVSARTRFNVASSRPLQGGLVALAGCTIHWTPGIGLTFAVANARPVSPHDPLGWPRDEVEDIDSVAESGSALARRDLAQGCPGFEARIELAQRAVFEAGGVAR